MIIIIFGLPGSGKSYFAAKLAKKLKAKYVSSDIIRSHLFILKDYTLEEKKKVYSEMVKEMEKAIQQNANIILDATFYKKSIRNMMSEAAKQYERRIIFIEVWADEKIIKERMKGKRQYSDADYSVYLHIKEVFEPMIKDHLVLHSTQENIDKMMDIAIKYIQENHE